MHGHMKKSVGLLLLILLPVFAAPKTELYSGTVLAVDEDYCGKSADYLLRMTLVTGSGVNVALVLAPKWYLHTRKIEIRTGDKAEVRALRSAAEGTLEVITIKIGGKTHSLRDAKGKALWKPEPGSEDLIRNICKVNSPGKSGG